MLVGSEIALMGSTYINRTQRFSKVENVFFFKSSYFAQFEPKVG